MTNVPLRFALRYLFARKSYNVINWISGIGALGMAVGTAALVIILSVFNGFNKIVSESFGETSADIVILPASGKVFTPDSALFAPVLANPDVITLSSTIQEQVFISLEGQQSLARVKGIDEVEQEEWSMKDKVVSGSWSFRKGSYPGAVFGAGLAHSIGANPSFVTPIEIFYPSRKEAVSMANPAASLRKARVLCTGVFSSGSEIDANTLIVPIGTVRELLEYETEVSSLELWTAPGEAGNTVKTIQEQVGDGFKVLDRFHQNESVFKMMSYEKLAIYLILIFVVIIIAFNIYSSLKMLVIEKQYDMGTLRSMGAPEQMLRKVFLYEGLLVSMLGMLAGLLIGVVLVIVQARFGIVPMPGNFLVESYPVVLKFTDLILIAGGVAVVGYLIALIPSRKI
ncbi:MAG: FtsX-like permease family protein [Bacteroidales bacterium]|nr:FtsX-like permease family protein [Bacteroidales bacterium]